MTVHRSQGLTCCLILALWLFWYLKIIYFLSDQSYFFIVATSPISNMLCLFNSWNTHRKRKCTANLCLIMNYMWRKATIVINLLMLWLQEGECWHGIHFHVMFLHFSALVFYIIYGAKVVKHFLKVWIYISKFSFF